MRHLPLRIGVGNQRAGLAQPKAPLPEQSLALPHPQLNMEALLDPGAQRLPIPQRARQTQLARGLAQGPINFTQLRFTQTPRTPATLALGQPPKSLGLKTSHPILDGARGISEQAADFWTSRALGHQQHSMETVIIARLFRPPNLVLQPEDHSSGISNLQWFHAYMKPQIFNMRNYLRR